MKLSEMNTNQGIETLMEITPYATNIMKDKKLTKVITEKMTTKGTEKLEEITALGFSFMIEKFNKVLPIVLKTHKNDVYGILSVLNEKSIEEIGEQNLFLTIKEIKEVVFDKEMIDFFYSLIQ